jgi:hypothetical protein
MFIKVVIHNENGNLKLKLMLIIILGKFAAYD